MQPSKLDKICFSLHTKLLDGKTDEIGKKAQILRIVSLAIGVFSAISSYLLFKAAFCGLPATFGFSALLIVPAAALGVIAHDSYKAYNCANIVIQRVAEQSNAGGDLYQNGLDMLAMLSNKPKWIQDVQKEVNSGILLPHILYQKVKVSA